MNSEPVSRARVSVETAKIENIKRGDDTHWRYVLYRRDPHCHWCGIVTVMPLRCTAFHQQDMATIDHIKCKPECTTQREYRSTNNRVLACHRCNNERDQAFTKKRPALIKQPMVAMRHPWQYVVPEDNASCAAVAELGDAIDGGLYFPEADRCIHPLSDWRMTPVVEDGVGPLPGSLGASNSTRTPAPAQAGASSQEDSGVHGGTGGGVRYFEEGV